MRGGVRLEDVFHLLTMVGAVVVLGLMVVAFARARRRPRFAKGDVVYQEWFASGASEKNLFTKLGAARNCLRLVVTREALWVTSWPPFNLLTPVYDLEHVIPLESITGLEESRVWLARTVRLTYVDAGGQTHSLRLVPRHMDRFLQSMGRGEDRAHE